MKLAIIDTLGLTYDGNTLNKRGLGGSESAVILISQELAKIGFDVTVFNNCIDSESAPGIYNNVKYIDHTQYQNDNAFDIVISSRSVVPFFAGNQYAEMFVNAKHRVLWMHDTFCEGGEHLEALVNQGFIDEIFTLSDFHSVYVTNCDHGNRRNFEVLKPYIWQTRNGAVKWINEVDVTQKDPNHFVYNASATKGLIPLLESVWPEIKNQIPNAHLTCIGGYYRFREGAEPDAQEKTVKKLMSNPKFQDLDVTFTGVIPQYEIAEILSNANFMLYPGAFPETYGISSLESLLYRTPIITSNFGALEETAIDQACYKINYAVEPNSLFPNINKESQIRNYVNTTVDAYHNTYMHQQKQYACDLVQDIYGWDTVALQWKQHFYDKFQKPLPVNEYREVSRINQKVSRVFGRRFSNSESINQYHSYGKEQRIVVISPFWNAENYIKQCIESVAQQDYDNYLHILIDDNSSDDSYKIAKDTINSFPKELQDKFVLIQNQENNGAIQNQVNVIVNYTLDNDIVMLLDGDDWLVNNNTIFQYYNDLYHQGYEFTYGSMWSVVDSIPLIAQDYPREIKKNKAYRDCKFNWGIPYTHLRTFRKQLFNNINIQNLKDNNNKWMMAGADNPFFYELINQADPEKIYCVKEIVCNYNDANPLNDYKIRSNEQTQNASNKKQKDQMNKKILVAIPTNKYIEPETFKSLWDLEISKGYELDFQYFYGYQIDQIRNLIADWAKRYDYLLSVDSDIVLPKDSLRKMLEADVDIISGLYIQRIPGTQTVEIYEDTPNGGVSNIPYRKLEDASNIVEVAACGFGAVLVKSEVFRQLPYPHFVYKSALDHKNTVSEDVYFCQKAREAGFRVWADTTIKCDHIGGTVFSLENNDQKFLRSIYNQDQMPKSHVEYLKNMNINPKVVYDIGSCVLHWSKKADKIWTNAEFYLFEAMSEVEFLYKEKPHKYHLGVLTDQDNKSIKFYKDVNNNSGGNSYYKENSNHFNESHAVSTTGMTLDTVVKQRGFPKPDLIKIDVQGAEIDVLKGAQETISQCNDVILEAQHVNYNEGAPKINQVTEFMKSIDYELVSNFCKNDIDGDYHFRKLSK